MPDYSKAPPRHLVFTRTVTPDVLDYLRTVRAGGMAIVCYAEKLPEKYRNQNTKDGITWQLLPAKADPELSGTYGMYEAAFHITNRMFERLKTHDPELLKDPLSGYDYENFLRFILQFDIARFELTFIPKCLSVLKALEKSPPERVTFLSQSFLFEETRDVLNACFPLLNQPSIHVQNIGALPKNPRALSDKIRLQRLKYQLQRLIKPSNKHLPKGATLATARAVLHLKMTAPALKILHPQRPLIFLNLFAAKGQDITFDDFNTHVDTILNFDDSAVTGFRDFLPLDHSLKNLETFFELRLGGILNENIPDREKIFYLHCLNKLHFFLKPFLRLEGMIHALEPSIVIGCLEKDSFSLALLELQKKYAFKLINMQHGIMPRTWTLQLFQFDAFLTWNTLSKNIIAADGYPNLEAVHVIGNPVWEELKTAYAQPISSGCAQDLLKWKRDDFMLVAYTQGYADYLPYEMTEEYLDAHFEFMQEHPNTKLIIKKHPTAEFDTMVEAYVEKTARQMGLQDRVRVCRAVELPLVDSFKLADLVTTIASTVLLDAASVGVPAMALDTGRLIEQLNYGIETVIPVAHTPDEAKALFQKYWSGNVEERQNLTAIMPDKTEALTDILLRQKTLPEGKIQPKETAQI